MQILYNYKPYAQPKPAIYNHDTNVYKLPDGWLMDQREATIIGETDDCYITRLQPSEHGEWINGEVVKFEYILPIGIHKSRFVRWVELQGRLF